MGKVIGILLFVIAIWLGLRTYLGEDMTPRDPEHAAVRPTQRVGERVQGAIDEGAERTEKLIPE